MNLRRSPWWLTTVSGLCILFTFDVVAVELECVVVPAKDQSDTVPGTKYKKKKTDYDSYIVALCNGWSSEDAVNHWLYGDYWPAYTGAPTTGTGRSQYITSHSDGPPSMTRVVCWDVGGSGGGAKKGGNLVGAYAWEYAPREKGKSSSLRGELTLHLLCTDRDVRRGGIGLKLMNMALKDAYKKIEPGQSLTLSLVALKKAEPFYNQLRMNCQDQGADEGKKYVVTMQWGIQLAEKARCAGTSAGNERIVYGCMDLVNYEKFESSVEGGKNGFVFEFLDNNDCVNWDKVQFDPAWIPE